MIHWTTLVVIALCVTDFILYRQLQKRIDEAGVLAERAFVEATNRESQYTDQFIEDHLVATTYSLMPDSNMVNPEALEETTKRAISELEEIWTVWQQHKEDKF